MMTNNSVATLSDFEKERIKECLIACAAILEDLDTHTFLGLSDQELKKVIEDWPSNSDHEMVRLAVNNCLNLLINGWDLSWSELGIKDSCQNIHALYDRLLGKKKLPPIYNKNDLIAYLAENNEPEYIFFWSSKGDKIGSNCLSQFYPAHFAINAIIYKSAEHYFMAEKARFFNDQDSLQKILKSKSPLAAKNLGRKIKNFNQEQWGRNRFDIAVRGNAAKFSQNNNLKKYLKETEGKILVEASPHDNVWGIGLTQDDFDAPNPGKWPGENLLGFALMKVRDEIL